MTSKNKQLLDKDNILESDKIKNVDKLFHQYQVARKVIHILAHFRQILISKIYDNF